MHVEPYGPLAPARVSAPRNLILAVAYNAESTIQWVIRLGVPRPRQGLVRPPWPLEIDPHGAVP